MNPALRVIAFMIRILVYAALINAMFSSPTQQKTQEVVITITIVGDNAVKRNGSTKISRRSVHNRRVKEVIVTVRRSTKTSLTARRLPVFGKKYIRRF